MSDINFDPNIVDLNVVDPNALVVLHFDQYNELLAVIRVGVIAVSLILGVLLCLVILYAKNQRRVW